MDTKDLIIQELEETSEPLLGEILDFVRFLKVKGNANMENQQDIADSYQALAEAKREGTISLDDFKSELGL